MPEYIPRQGFAAWWYLSAIRRALLRDPRKIDAYNRAVDRYNSEIS